jgi:hypothetical protein
MSTTSRLVFGIVTSLFISVVLFSPILLAQSAIEELATQQIAERTGIDESQLATLFVSDGQDQFILAFVYITQEVLESDLRPNLKEAVANFVGQNAMLTLVAPTRLSQFSPGQLSFQQDDVTNLIVSGQIFSISDDFQSGQIESNNVAAGVIVLPPNIDVSRQFNIVYQGKFIAPFSVTGVVVPPDNGVTVRIPGFLMAILQFILMIFLLPFLVI